MLERVGTQLQANTHSASRRTSREVRAAVTVLALAAIFSALRGKSPPSAPPARERPVVQIMTIPGRLAFAGTLGVLLALNVVIVVISVAGGTATTTDVARAAYILAGTQFGLNLLREYDGRRWTAANIVIGTFAILLALAGFASDPGWTLIAVVLTGAALLGLIFMTAADARGFTSSTWMWLATPTWRSAVQRQRQQACIRRSQARAYRRWKRREGGRP